MRVLNVYAIDGEYLGRHRFEGGHPMRGDCFLINSRLVYVYSRRWADTGEIELIVTWDEPVVDNTQ